jgi:hypothetical protein
MEAVAWQAGEPHGDQPSCVCPVIATFGKSWNDALGSDDERSLLLKPLVPLVIGTRSSVEVENRRAFLALDWLIRIQLPAWLHLTESLRMYTRILYEYPEVCDSIRAEAALPILNAARDAAQYVTAASSGSEDWSRSSRFNPPQAPPRNPAWIIAGHVAGEALRNSAATSARTAAREIAGEAAWDAWDAGREAAWAAAGAPALAAAKSAGSVEAAKAVCARQAAIDSLQFTVSKLQLSAVDLLHQMIGLK